MQHDTPVLLIDNVNFAKRNERLTGTLALKDCERLQALLAAQNPEGATLARTQDKIDYALTGEVNAAGQLFLHLKLTAQLTTFCQRCLGVMPLPMQLAFDYMVSDLANDDAQLDALEAVDDYDLQAPSPAMDVLALIEDELMMALPIAPVHAQDCTPHSMQSGEKPNPFAVLKGLIK